MNTAEPGSGADLHRSFVGGYVEKEGLRVDTELHDFIMSEALPGSGTDAPTFWGGLRVLVERFAPRNAELLAVRARMQRQLDEWYRDHAVVQADAYRAFLCDIGYLVPAGDQFSITTEGTDPEIASVAGPQLVVPVMNARYALNAANARWARSTTRSMAPTPWGGHRPADRTIPRAVHRSSRGSVISSTR